MTTNCYSMTAVSICCLLVLSDCERQKFVAEVNGKEISVDEFRDRYTAYIQSQASTRDNILLREQILNNMINEQLIYQDAHYQKFDGDEKYKQRMIDIREQALLDRYAKSVSSDTVTVSEQELWKEFRAFNSKVAARYVYAKTEQEAWKLRERLEVGVSFEELAKDVFKDPGLANNGGYLGYFGWGDMEPELEDAAFSLPIGRLSDPIKLSMGYAIVKVENRVELPLSSEYDYAKNKEKLERAILDKKVVHLIKKAAVQVERELSPTFNDEAAKLLFDNWQFVFSEQAATAPKEMQAQIENLTDMQLVKFQNHSWTVGAFLEKVQQTTPKQRRHINSIDDIKSAATGLAVREVLLARAHQAGFSNDRGVVEQIKKAREVYLLKRWTSSVQDTVGQNGWDGNVLREQYEKNKDQYRNPPEVNVAEILVRSKDDANGMMKQLGQGADFAELARKNSIRLWAAKNGGELGYETKSTYGALGDMIFSAKRGKVIGPEFVDPYFGIFKIIGKKDGRPKTFDESKGDIIKQLEFVKKEEVFKTRVESLRAHAQISIDKDILANIDIN